MVYQVVKTIKGRGYLYEQRTWRDGKCVRTESRYLGPVNGGTAKRKHLTRKIVKLVKANMTPRREFAIDEEQMLKDQNASAAREQQARGLMLADLYGKYGLHVADTPKGVTAIPAVQAESSPNPDHGAKESPSDVEGQDTQNS